MNKRNLTIVIAIFIIIPGIISVISMMDKRPSDERYEMLVQAIVASPKSVELVQNGQDIRNDFLDEYKDSIENGDYTEAIDFLEVGGINISISINEENEFLLEGME